MRARNRYLKQRGDRFYYYRRVPQELATADPRGTIRISLKTDNLSLARERRDQLEKADERYWAAISNGDARSALLGYHAAVDRSLAYGFSYIPCEELATKATVSELMSRLDTIKNGKDMPTAVAVLGEVKRPKVKLTEALDVYMKEIAASQISGKSPAQLAAWTKIKTRAVTSFKKVVGDIPLEDITRDHARKFYNWWLERIVPPKGATQDKPLSPLTGNRDMGNLRLLYESYFKHIGEEGRQNPFRNLSFEKIQRTERASFPTDWITKQILKPGALDNLNVEARLIVYTLIETGARPSEICNLMPDQIKLDAPVPHISIRSSSIREIKTKSSRRDIPIVGVSLAAMRKAPHGFPRYRDRETALSSNLNKRFRAAGLFPSENHFIYSFRHSFEKRMTESGLDYGLRWLSYPQILVTA